MALRHTYFSANGFNPMPWLDRRLNPYRHATTVNLRGQPVHVQWTRRAQAALDRRTDPLCVEMQLYFSCVVKKRVLFHEPPDPHVYTRVVAALRLRASAVESDVCSPEDFAAGYPARRELETEAALRMVPRSLWLDYCHGEWVGEMGFDSR